MSTAAGIIRAFAELPYFLAIPASIGIAATGIAQISAINSAQPGGGAGGVSFSGPPTLSDEALNRVPSLPPGDPSRGPVEIHVFLEGEGFFQVSMEELAQTVAEAYAQEAGFAGIPTGAFTDG